MSAEQEHAYIRTVAALVVAVALVVVAWSAYRIAEAEQEQACWAWITAHYGSGVYHRVTALEMHNECDAFR
jgi:hypothetical protein